QKTAAFYVPGPGRFDRVIRGCGPPSPGSVFVAALSRGAQFRRRRRLYLQRDRRPEQEPASSGGQTLCRLRGRTARNALGREVTPPFAERLSERPDTKSSHGR